MLTLDNGTYIIQNVQLSDRYIELTGTTIVEALRNDDQGVATQHWVVTETDGGYTIKSAAGDSYLGVDPQQPLIVAQAQPATWVIVADPQSDRFHITTPDNQHAVACADGSLGSAPGGQLALHPADLSDDAARWWFRTQYPPAD